jgi:hypothetical protein
MTQKIPYSPSMQVISQIAISNSPNSHEPFDLSKKVYARKKEEREYPDRAKHRSKQIKTTIITSSTEPDQIPDRHTQISNISLGKDFPVTDRSRPVVSCDCHIGAARSNIDALKTGACV